MGKVREFITVLLLGFFIGLAVGYYIGHNEVTSYLTKTYEAEVKCLQEWNKTMLKTMTNMIEKKR